MSVVKQFNLKAGDKLDWAFGIKEGEMVMVVRPVVTKQSVAP
jgi:hypothetical protein